MTERASGNCGTLEGIEAVAFDAFGTLIDYPLRLHPYRRFLAKGEAAGAGRLDPVVRREILTSSEPIEQLAQKYGLQAQAPAMLEELAKELAAVRLYPDVLDAIRFLRAAGLRIGVCSNLAQAYGPVVRKLLGEHVDALVLSFEVGLVKPEVAMFETLSDQLGVAPCATLFIGNSVTSDIDGATGAGMTARLIRRATGQTLRDLL